MIRSVLACFGLIKLQDRLLTDADDWAGRFLPWAESEAMHDRGFSAQRDLCW